MEKLLSRKEAAKLLGVSLPTLDLARSTGLISYRQDQLCLSRNLP